MATVAKLDAHRLGSTLISPNQIVLVEGEVTARDAGVQVDQVLTIDGRFRVVVDSRFFSYDFYSRAIAKFAETLT